LAFSPDCKTLASGNSDTEVELWDWATGEKLLTLGEYQDEHGIDSIAFCAEGKTLVATDGDSVKLWNIANRKCTVIVDPWYWMAWRRPGLYRYLAGIWPGLANDRTIAMLLIPN
jgi:WD40 repeat protein